MFSKYSKSESKNTKAIDIIEKFRNHVTKLFKYIFQEVKHGIFLDNISKERRGRYGENHQLPATREVIFRKFLSLKGTKCIVINTNNEYSNLILILVKISDKLVDLSLR